MHLRQLYFFLLTIILVTLLSCGKTVENKRHETAALRAPAYPLVTIDPYTSAWSMSDRLYDTPVMHWTRAVHSLIGAVRVDGTVYRFLGKEENPMKAVIPMAPDESWDATLTENTPKSGWEKPDFKTSGWKRGKAALGSTGMKAVGTVWDSDEIWVRREFIFPTVADGKELFLVYSHDDDFELYLNGKQLVSTGNSAKSDVILKIEPAELNKGKKNVIAAHCRDRGGLNYVDFGIYTTGDRREIFDTTAEQEGVAVSATQTLYEFTCGPVGLALKFTSPLLPDDLDLLSRPINYIDYSVKSKDGREHDVQIYFEMTPQWAVNEVNQEVEIQQGSVGNVSYLKTGTTEQPVLQRAGDNVRIDWGYAYLAANNSPQSTVVMGEYVELKEKFKQGSTIEGQLKTFKGFMKEIMPALSYVNNMRSVGTAPVSDFIMIGYDDLASIQYFGDNRKAWWTQDGKVNMNDALKQASAEHAKVIDRCIAFDNTLFEESLKAGGEKYADLCVLAYRQSVAAHKLTKDNQGKILFLSKENFSNGSIGTVDVTYPSAPLYLRYNPELLKGMLNPIFYYSESGKWTKPFAAHDVGTYPKANGQTYGDDMPVEECGNMLILTAAIAKATGNADYAREHWRVLTTWARYLMENGLDPENQLCTDDFAGHFAHNANLSVKAIMGIASYGMLADMIGEKENAARHRDAAARMAAEWQKMADDGDHYRLTFDKPGTWSQKYNLVWDKILGFNLFPETVFTDELNYYLTKQKKFGLPLDSRRTYTKSDWIVWTATLANDRATFEKFIDPVHEYVTQTKSRVPMSDWYETTNADQVGFQARSVVGGYFIKVLADNMP